MRLRPYKRYYNEDGFYSFDYYYVISNNRAILEGEYIWKSLETL